MRYNGGMNEVFLKYSLPNTKIFQIVQGDITTENVDAIVNAANDQLQHGGGVAWTISRRGGKVIQRESRDWVREHGLVSHAQPAWTYAEELQIGRAHV